MKARALGNSNLRLPRVVFGTGSLGNQFEALSDETKLEVSREWFKRAARPVFLDTAGKYGAGWRWKSSAEICGNLPSIRPMW